MRILGIDPGLSGAYALLGPSPALGETFPITGKSLDLPELASEWAAFEIDLAVIERVHAMPKQGVTSMFTFGRGLGQIEGILAALRIRVEYVTPQAWKAEVLAGTPKDKDSALRYARNAFANVNLIPPGKRKPHDGIADALCIAEYGRRTFARS